jgi:hypothetical protein
MAAAFQWSDRKGNTFSVTFVSVSLDEGIDRRKQDIVQGRLIGQGAVTGQKPLHFRVVATPREKQ